MPHQKSTIDTELRKLVASGQIRGKEIEGERGRRYFPTDTPFTAPTPKSSAPKFSAPKSGTRRDELLTWLRENPEGGTAGDIGTALKLNPSQVNSAIKAMQKKQLIAWIRKPGVGSPGHYYSIENAPPNAETKKKQYHYTDDKPVAQPPPSGNGAAAPIDSFGLLTGEKTKMLYDWLCVHSEGCTGDELCAAVGVERKNLHNKFRTLRDHDLLRWTVHANPSGKGTHNRYYATHLAPPDAGAVKRNVKMKKKRGPYKKREPAPKLPLRVADPSVDTALDAISILAAERETYKQALEQISTIITQALKGQ